MKKINIAIDGYSSCGKSSTAKRLAVVLTYTYIDSGAMYRAVTLYFLQNHVTISNTKDVNRALSNIKIEFRRNSNNQNEIYLNGLNVEGKIRNITISNQVSEVAAIKEVREFLVAQQQMLGKKKGVVMDGRDIGTVVFPDAELKFFMTADLRVRAIRRQRELLEKGEVLSLEEVEANLIKRDKIDSSRETSPLIKAEDAIEIDTTNLTFPEQLEMVINIAEETISQA